MRPIVTLLSTGGTVSTTTDASGQSTARLGDRELAELVDVPGVTLETIELRRQPSWALTPRDMAEIAVAARDIARRTAMGGVVVTHGTTTLEYTAFLADLVLDAPAPVVFTGAMRRADDAEPDGPANLADAVRVAAHPAARGLGALVVFAGRVISAGRVWKARRLDMDAFVDLGGDLGHVAPDGVVLDRARRRRPIFEGSLDDRVAFVKAVPGADGGAIEAVLARGARGLVIEALPGVGGIPPRMQAAVATAAARMPVVVASRAPYGRAPKHPTGGTGEPLRGLELLSAGDLTAEQAWLLLMAALGESGDRQTAERRFIAAAAAGDPLGKP